MRPVTRLRDTRATVDLGAFRRNVGRLRSVLERGVMLMAVVKADAYGHGLLPVSRAAVEAGADWLGVAIPEEGVAIREAGLRCPILVFGGVNAAGARAAAEKGLTATVFDERGVSLLEQAGSERGSPVSVHLAADTGMGRIGVRTEGQLDALAAALKSSSHVRLEGVFTHFSDADNPDSSHTDLQLSRFTNLLKRLPPGLNVHAAASAAALSRKDTHFSMVRAGIALYGYPPVRTPLGFEPCLSLRAEITSVKTIEAGEPVGYGRAYLTKDETRVAVLAAGYADGYPRSLSSKAFVIIRGRLCPVLGRVCMDQVMVDVSAVPEVRPGETAVLIGTEGDATVTAEHLAGWAGTIPYEILLAQRRRVPCDYPDNGE